MCDKIVGMKKELLKHLLTSVIAVGSLALLFVISQSVIAQGGGSSPFLNLNNNFNVEKFQLAPINHDNPSANDPNNLSEPQLASSLEGNVVFRNYGSSILNQTSVATQAIFDYDYSQQAPGTQTLNIGFNNFNVPSIARLQVGGSNATVRVSALADANDPNVYCVCADQYGTMRRCGIYDPANGQMCSGTSTAPSYSCTGAVPSNATMCAGANVGLISNIPNSVVASCGAPMEGSGGKCTYTCNAGYILQAGVCIAN